jgi:hypothetical protein
VALVADHYLTPKTREKVQAILAGDTSHLTHTTELADEATWADKYRDSDRNTTKVRYRLTRAWHFVDVDIDGGTVDAACPDHAEPPARASGGPAEACVVDRINAFVVELNDPATDADERRAALQFLLHFVGDIHQPLHASTDDDKGGNDKTVKAASAAANSLHHYWDTEFVKKLGSDPRQIADRLANSITARQMEEWAQGDATSWAKQSYELSKLRVYGDLGDPDGDGQYFLSEDYVTDATNAVARQLARAGVRLARILNDAFEQE